MSILIIGGGMAGLTAAYRARQLAPAMPITLIEAADALGGKVQTTQEAGFVLEAAPDCFLSRKPEGIALCEELGIAEELVGRLPVAQPAYVWRHGRLHTLPAGLSGMVPTDVEALRHHSLLSPAGAERVGQEPNVPVRMGDEDESLADFMSRRLGREAFENIVEPLMGGIYAGRADQLSLAATFPQLRQLEQKQGSLLKGLAGATAVSSSYPPFVSFAGGMGRLVDELVARLEGVDIRLNSRAERVWRTAAGWHVALGEEVLTADSLILATPAFVTADLLAETAPELAELHAAIPYASVALVNLGYATADLPPLPDSYGYVTPLVEGRRALAVTWSSQKWPNRAPAGQLLLRVYLGRYGEPDVTALDDETLLAWAREEVAEVCGIGAREMFGRVVRWPRAMPQYTLGHPERLRQIELALAEVPGLFLAGAAYRGVGIPDCIREGDKAGRAAVGGVKSEK